MNSVVGRRSSVVSLRSWVVGRVVTCGTAALGYASRGHALIALMVREIFDEAAWQRFSARNHDASFGDFLRERHGRPRQRCC